MKRDLEALTKREFDILIIGGGIYGAALAWEAVLRGLSVALVEKNDFGHATSSNSSRIIHGGFRYIQNMDIKRLRESSRERNILMRIAPHLVGVLPFVVPTYSKGIQRKEILGAMLKLYDMFAWNRNKGIQDPERKIPAGHLISREECLKYAPHIPQEGLTGGAVWYDGFYYNTERLVLAFLHSAAELGAQIANYLEVISFLKRENQIYGVRVKDTVLDQVFEMRGKLIISASGPWVNRLLSFANGKAIAKRETKFVKVISLLTRSITRHGYGASLVSSHVRGQNCAPAGGSRRLHAIPWRGQSIIASLNLFTPETPDEVSAREEELRELLNEINRAYPGVGLKREEVILVHMGFLPIAPNGNSNPYKVSKKYQIIDHEIQDGIKGLISVIGVKYTTARDVAEKTVTGALKKLKPNFKIVRSPNRNTPLWGGDVGAVSAFLEKACEENSLAEDIIRQLVFNYGSNYLEILNYVSETPALKERVSFHSSVLKAEVIHAIRKEMAQTLKDVVFRRTELGTLGYPGREALEACASLMAAELGWDQSRINFEIEEVEKTYKRLGVSLSARASEKQKMSEVVT